MWHTSLRKLNTDGTNPTILQEFGDPKEYESPVGAYAMSYDPLARQFYIASGQGTIIRTEIDGSNPTTVITEARQSTWITSVVVHGVKLYYGIGYEGILKRANLDGSGKETFLNISQGINFSYGKSYTPAYSYPNGIAIDEANNFIYYSVHTSDLPHGGSIRRAPLQANTTKIEVLAQDIYDPEQLRLLKNSTLYWAEIGPYSGGATAIRRAYFPPNESLEPGDVAVETLVSSNTTNLLPYGIASFAISEEEGKVWVAANSAAAKSSGGVLEMDLNGKGLRVLNDNVTQIGVPAGIEYVV